MNHEVKMSSQIRSMTDTFYSAKLRKLKKKNEYLFTSMEKEKVYATRLYSLNSMKLVLTFNK